MKDVVVVGGGPAGIATALALVQAEPSLSSRLVVLEKGTYPREKYCAGAFGRRGEKLLAELDAVPDVPSVPVEGMSLRVRGGEVSARTGAIGRVVRRIEFDHALAREAIRRGIEVVDGTKVESIVRDADGVRVTTSRGEIAAQVVVGADGVGSVVRKAMGLSAGALRAQVLEIDTEPVPGDRDRALLHFDAADPRLAGYTWDFPTIVDGRPLVCRGAYRLKLGTGAGEVPLETLLAERLDAMGLDLAAYPNKRYAERGFEPAARVAEGPMMLVGEAAGIDAVTGEGIAQAIEYGVMAGRFLARALREGGSASIEGWSRTVAESRLARDLRIRHAFIKYFYKDAGSREMLEEFLAGSSDTVHVGCQHFADAPIDYDRLVEILARGAAHWVGLGVRRLLAG